MTPGKKVCPMKFSMHGLYSEKCECNQEMCAWWCEWTESCAMVSVAVSVEDRLDEIRKELAR